MNRRGSGPARHSALGRRLIAGLDEAAAHMRKQADVPGRTAHTLLAVIAREPEAVRRALASR